MPNDDFPDAGVVGGWWNRQNNPEVDLVAVDNAVPPTGGRVRRFHQVAGQSAVRRSDLADLARVSSVVPGADNRTPLAAVSRSGFTVIDLAATFTPDTPSPAGAAPRPVEPDKTSGPVRLHGHRPLDWLRDTIAHLCRRNACSIVDCRHDNNDHHDPR